MKHGHLRAHDLVDAEQRQVDARFEQQGSITHFRVAGHDLSRQLVIDPTIAYEQLIGDSLNDSINGVAADIFGNVYVVGHTESPNFGTDDAFLMKLNSQGGEIFRQSLGGSSQDDAYAVAVDDLGRPTVVGRTYSSDFPIQNAFQASLADRSDAFISRLTADGTAYEFSTYYGGHFDESLDDVALDPTGKAWAIGSTTSSDLLTPGGYQWFGNGCQACQGSDMLVARFETDGTLSFATFLGGSGNNDFGQAVAVDLSGNAYVSGHLGSIPKDFVLKINGLTLAGMGEIVSDADFEGLAVDRLGRLYGAALANEVDELPTTADAAQPVHGGGGLDAYVVRFGADWAPTGPPIEYATFIGDADSEEGRDIAVDLQGNMYVMYYSLTIDFEWNPSRFGFAVIAKTGQLLFQSEFGEPNDQEVPNDVAVDIWGNAYLVGEWNEDTPEGTPPDGKIFKFNGTFDDIEPSCQDCEQDVGSPVNLYTGNVWLSQTDATVGGLMGIGLSRSYNSQGNREPMRTELGIGWTHSFDRSVVLMPDGRLRFRQGSGAPMYFTGPGGSLPYTASAPASETSTFQKVGTNWVRSFKEGGSETYDDRGRLTQIQDIVGNTLSLTRQAGSLTVQDPGGRSLNLLYDSGGRLTELTSGGLSLATYAYGANGQLDSVSYPDGTGFRYEYDERGQLLVMRDASGQVVETHSYDGDRAISSEVAGGQERLTLAYEATRTHVTDALGHTATYEYQSVGGMKKVTSRTGPCASCGGQESEAWTYTSEGRVETHTGGAGRVTRYSYEADGDLASETMGFGTGSARTTNYTWDANSRPLSRAAPGEGIQEWADYVAAGPRTVRVPLDGTRTRTTTTLYNPNGTIASVTDPDDSAKKTEYQYFDSGPIQGDLEWVEDLRNYRTFFGYDVLGRRNAVTDANGNATVTEYDVRGRVTKVTQTVQEGGSPVSLVTSFTYNNRGLKESVKDPEGRITRYAYDDFGRLLSVIDDDGNATRYSYDVLSHVTSITNAKGRTWTFAYDPYGRLVTTTWPGGRTETLTYYGDGQVHTRTDRRGVTTTYSYDALGRLQTKSYSDGTPTITYGYDAAGRPNSIVEAGSPGQSIARQYLLSGELSQEIQTRGATSGTFDYDYKLSGRREDVKLGGQIHLQYAYDGDVLLSLTHGTRVFSVGFDPATRRYVLAHPNNLLTEYKYDEDNRLRSVKYGTGTVDTLNLGVNFTTLLGQSVYNYDKAGNRTSKTALDHAESYDYDELHRLSYVSRTGAGARTWSYDYDEVGNRGAQVTGGLAAGGGQPSSAGALSVSYSDRNELQSYAAGGTLAVRGTISEPGTVGVYTAATGELPARMVGQQAGYLFEADVAVNSGVNSFEIRARDTANHLRTNQYTVNVPADSASYSYDNNGNLLSRADSTGSWGYEWTAENQLKRVTLNSIEVARFTYDPLGRRVEKVAGGVTTSYLYDGDDILQETVTGGASPGTFRYIHGPGIDEPLARIQNPGPSEVLTYFHADGLGSIVATTSQAGAIVSSRRYDAWGNLEVGASTPGYAFTGREWDPETALYYYRARYYDPKVGRFISEDPIGFTAGVNFYAYVSGNPTGLRDPSGKDWIDFVAGFGDTLTYGGTAAVRQWLETDNLIDQSNWSYTFGEAAGVGLSMVGGGAAGAGAAGAKAAGREFSHWIPDRILKNFGSKWLRKGFGRSCFNGNYVTTAEHALADPYRYRFMPRSWKAGNPLPSAGVRQWNRIPLLFRGAGAGGALGLGGVASNDLLVEDPQ